MQYRRLDTVGHDPTLSQNMLLANTHHSSSSVVVIDWISIISFPIDNIRNRYTLNLLQEHQQNTNNASYHSPQIFSPL